MALKPTIYKFMLSVSDLDRHYYETLNLTVAQHPSETMERMMTRVLAFCHNASDKLSFASGLSSPNEPDIWERNLDGQLLSWIDVGEPNAERIKKASHHASRVKIYSFNSKSDVWWQQEKSKIEALNADVFQFPWKDIQALAPQINRTIEATITISETTSYIATEKGETEIPLNILQQRS